MKENKNPSVIKILLNSNNDEESMSEFGIKEIEKLAKSFSHDYKFYKHMRFILSGLVVFCCSMIYVIMTTQNTPTWLNIAGWVLFAGSVVLDLIVVNTQVLSAESKLRMLGYTNEKEIDE